MDPESLFALSSKRVKLPKFPIDAGVEPVRMLLYKESILRDVRFPSWWGMDPERLLS